MWIELLVANDINMNISLLRLFLMVSYGKMNNQWFYNLLLGLSVLDNFRVVDGKLPGRSYPHLIHLSLDYSSDCEGLAPVEERLPIASSCSLCFINLSG